MRKLSRSTHQREAWEPPIRDSESTQQHGCDDHCGCDDHSPRVPRPPPPPDRGGRRRCRRAPGLPPGRRGSPRRAPGRGRRRGRRPASIAGAGRRSGRPPGRRSTAPAGSPPARPRSTGRSERRRRRRRSRTTSSSAPRRLLGGGTDDPFDLAEVAVGAEPGVGLPHLGQELVGPGLGGERLGGKEEQNREEGSQRHRRIIRSRKLPGWMSSGMSSRVMRGTRPSSRAIRVPRGKEAQTSISGRLRNA